MIPLFSCSAPPPAARAAEVELDLVPTVMLVPVQYRHHLVQQLSLAEDNQQTWLRAIANVKPEHREALAFLLVNMPENDLKKLTGEQLSQNVELAYRARESSAWARAVPEEIFFRDVLPYANVDEVRDDWRQDFFDRFMPLVKNANSASEAALILNREVFKSVNVKYHATKREKPNQSPYESMKIGYASCTGLSIILSDACRAVGAPARVVGTPLWSDRSGNHTWTEVWDKQWYFLGSAEPGKLNETWFVDNAAKADASKPEMRIYAESFEQTPIVFPLVWDTDQSTVHAVDVTGYYTGRQTLTVKIPANTSVQIREAGLLQAAASDPTNAFTLAAGAQYTVALLDSSGKTVSSRTVLLPKDNGASVDLAGGQ